MTRAEPGPRQLKADYSLQALIAPGGLLIRRAMTQDGPAWVRVRDRFDEVLIEAHWRVVSSVRRGQDDGELGLFEGVEVDGRALAFSARQLPETDEPGASV
jgi:hypothetical protein